MRDGKENAVELEKKYSSHSHKNSSPQFVIENSVINFNSLIEHLKPITAENISVIKLNRVSITDDTLCFMLDYFARFSTSLQELVLENIKCINTEKISLKIKQFV